MSSKIKIGGQAVMEGVMMRSKTKYAICVRRPDKKISTKIIKTKQPKHWFPKLPIIRGFLRFAETLSIGIKSISYSALESQGEEDESISGWEMFLTIAFSIILTILLFYAAPLLLTRFILKETGLLFNLIDGMFRLIIFVLYVCTLNLLV